MIEVTSSDLARVQVARDSGIRFYGTPLAKLEWALAFSEFANNPFGQLSVDIILNEGEWMIWSLTPAMRGTFSELQDLQYSHIASLSSGTEGYPFVYLLTDQELEENKAIYAAIAQDSD